MKKIIIFTFVIILAFLFFGTAKIGGAVVYPDDFEHYWSSINPTFEKNEINKELMFEQWETLGPPSNYTKKIK